MQPTDTPIAHPQVALREFDDGIVLFHPLTGEAVGLGALGLTIWQLLDGRRTLAEVTAAIQAQCEDAPATTLVDTLAFADDLRRRLFVLTEPPASSSPTPTAALPSAHPLPMLGAGEGFTLSLADGTRLALCAGDETAARVVDFLARAARLSPAPTPLPPGARRLLVLTAGGQDVTQSVPHADTDAVCVLEPPGVLHPRLSPPDVAADDLLLVSEPLTGERWFWQQLTRLSAGIARQMLPRGGVLLHSGLAAYFPSPQGGKGRGEGGVLLAGRSGVGKSTASRRLPLPSTPAGGCAGHCVWRALADEATLVVRDEAPHAGGTYWAHPWPTWSRFFGEKKGDGRDTWDVQRAVPLRAIFVLEQGAEDRAEPLGPGHAVALLAELARQTSTHLMRGLPLDEIAAFNRQRFENLCALVRRAVPAYTLHVSLEGAFWEEMERALGSQ
ncbi:MAG: SynChlorMet cassette protein ScmC [Chloroflexi bacterium]|nr:SynChlorMet cassette protein ScmC [Chloroflexota bacterium]MBU1748252.1 SynChlorMet cassette protein ScmC [Chloroflexota bacterium]